MVRNCLVDLGVRVLDCDLPVADYVFAGRVGVERKTIRDLHRSIINRRLWVQVAGLRADLRRAFLLIEGPTLDGSVSRAGVRGALLAVMELGVIVVRTENGCDSAAWLQQIGFRCGRGAPERVKRSVRRGRQGPEAVLVAVPGIAPATARRLLAHFGSVSAIAAAKPHELKSIPGIGVARAASLNATLASRPPGPS